MGAKEKRKKYIFKNLLCFFILINELVKVSFCV